MNGTPKHSFGAGCDAVSPSRKGLATGLVLTMASFMALCTKHTSRAAKKLKAKVTTATSNNRNKQRLSGAGAKKLFTSVSNKAITLVHRKRASSSVNKKGFNEVDDDEVGDGGVWQRAILMGDKCQPLDFSGVIYYDSNGKQLNEVPLRSPRASPLPGYLTK